MFSLPQGASLRQTEEELTTPTPRQGDAYGDMALGTALRDEDGFAKVLVGDDEIFGCHVIGLEALTLIHKGVQQSATGRRHNIPEIIPSH